jgi:hypothetical protein
MAPERWSTPPFAEIAYEKTAASIVQASPPIENEGSYDNATKSLPV